MEVSLSSRVSKIGKPFSLFWCTLYSGGLIFMLLQERGGVEETRRIREEQDLAYQECAQRDLERTQLMRNEEEQRAVHL
jgi:hypothetical protein